MNATEFINYLDAQQLLEVTILDQLRQLVSRTDQEVSAESLVKLLVEQGHLTRFQGSRLLADVPEKLESLEIKHVDSLDGEIEVKPEKDVEPPQEVGEEIVDLTSLGDNKEEEIVDLEQVEALPASSLNNDPLLDFPPVPGQQLMDPVDPGLTKAGPLNVMDKVAKMEAALAKVAPIVSNL